MRCNVFRDSQYQMRKSTKVDAKVDQEGQCASEEKEPAPEGALPSEAPPTEALSTSTNLTKNPKEKLHTKYLVIGTLERGDSFGFGEDLTNIYLVSATESECLVIPGHIMMTAERHIEVMERESSQARPEFEAQGETSRSSIVNRSSRNENGLLGAQNDGLAGMASTHDIISAATMRTNNRRKSVIGGEVRKPIILPSKMKQKNQHSHGAHGHAHGSHAHETDKRTSTNMEKRKSHHRKSHHHKTAHHGDSGHHHYDELRELIESKIMGEEESFQRWRQAIDWKNYKGEILSEIIERKDH